MISFPALFLWILSAVYPTFRTSASLNGDMLTLRMLNDKPSSVYRVVFVSGMYGIGVNGDLSVKGTTAHIDKAISPEPGNDRPLPLPDTSVELDTNLKRKGEAEPFIPLDLMRLAGKSEFKLKKGRPMALGQAWKTSKLHGMVTFKGLVDGYLLVESTGHVVAGDKEFEFTSTIEFPADGGDPEDLVVDMKYKGVAVSTVRLKRAPADTSFSSKLSGRVN